ncbi:sensor histidine kinase [Dialister sp.]|uniref:sensor histidine kinase n=1 Tax=Dialister sp. TaxID=1955814 RepID=UPI002E816E6E|nr:ATP-binding protein [Dialister sp.]MEE3453093.1 ATP-binding protein [Dialister sp.]
MKVRIYRSLLLMGILSVVLTFILSAVLYYQGMVEQFSHEVQHLNIVMAESLSMDEEARGKDYLGRVFKENKGTIHIVWLDDKGFVIYDSDGVTDEDYASGKEVREAMEKGMGSGVHKDASGNPKSYYARKAPDGSILRLSSMRSVSYAGFSAYLPEIAIFFLAFIVGCLFAAERETLKILKPFQLLGDLVQDIMEGKKVTPPAAYEELQPLISKVEEQHDEIESYLEDLEEERNTIQIVFNTISDGIILLNAHKEIVFYNTKTEEIFKPGEDKRYRRIASLYHDEDWLRVIGKAYRTEGRQQYTLNLFDKPYRMVMTQLELTDGQKGLLIVLRDMTASYMAEKMRREFSANVSHELKTPLTSISGFAEMIANGMYQQPEDVKFFGSRIVNESHRMLTLIDTIMHLSRIEETETTITWKTVSLDSLVHYAAELIEPQAKAKNVTITVDTEPLYAYGNAALLSELIMNLLDNAVKYNNVGGSVHAILAPEGENQIKLTVSDTGIGIPKEKQSRVFERFYRAEESRNKATGGTGLGLAICKHIVDKHKGNLSVSSEEGKGTIMTVILPRVSEADVSKEEIETLTARQEAEEAESGALAQQEAEEDRKAEEAGTSREEMLKPEKPIHKEKKNKKKKKKSLDREKGSNRTKDKEEKKKK